MKAFVIVALVAAVSGEADPYTIGQVILHKNRKTPLNLLGPNPEIVAQLPKIVPSRTT